MHDSESGRATAASSFVDNENRSAFASISARERDCRLPCAWLLLLLPAAGLLRRESSTTELPALPDLAGFDGCAGHWGVSALEKDEMAS